MLAVLSVFRFAIFKSAREARVSRMTMKTGTRQAGDLVSISLIRVCIPISARGDGLVLSLVVVLQRVIGVLLDA